MAYFTQDYLDFFSELEQNNHKEWFDAHRKRYEKSVKDPFKAFVADLIEAMADLYDGIPMTPREAIFRINRDIRFSKDKTPYKDHMAAIVSKYGKKDHTRPGMYFQANHKDLRVYSGCYSPNKEELQAVREKIADNLKTFQSILADKSFKETFGEVQGEKHKRIPKEFHEAATQEPLLYNKGYYYFFTMPPETLLEDDLIKQLMDGYKKAMPINAFLTEALGG